MLLRIYETLYNFQIDQDENKTNSFYEISLSGTINLNEISTILKAAIDGETIFILSGIDFIYVAENNSLYLNFNTQINDKVYINSILVLLKKLEKHDIKLNLGEVNFDSSTYQSKSDVIINVEKPDFFSIIEEKYRFKRLNLKFIDYGNIYNIKELIDLLTYTYEVLNSNKPNLPSGFSDTFNSKILKIYNSIINKITKDSKNIEPVIQIVSLLLQRISYNVLIKIKENYTLLKKMDENKTNNFTTRACRSKIEKLTKILRFLIQYTYLDKPILFVKDKYEKFLILKSSKNHSFITFIFFGLFNDFFPQNQFIEVLKDLKVTFDKDFVHIMHYAFTSEKILSYLDSDSLLKTFASMSNPVYFDFFVEEYLVPLHGGYKSPEFEHVVFSTNKFGQTILHQLANFRLDKNILSPLFLLMDKMYSNNLVGYKQRLLNYDNQHKTVLMYAVQNFSKGNSENVILALVKKAKEIFIDPNELAFFFRSLEYLPYYDYMLFIKNFVVSSADMDLIPVHPKTLIKPIEIPTDLFDSIKKSLLILGNSSRYIMNTNNIFSADKNVLKSIATVVELIENHELNFNLDNLYETLSTFVKNEFNNNQIDYKDLTFFQNKLFSMLLQHFFYILNKFYDAPEYIVSAGKILLHFEYNQIPLFFYRDESTQNVTINLAFKEKLTPLLIALKEKDVMFVNEVLITAKKAYGDQIHTLLFMKNDVDENSFDYAISISHLSLTQLLFDIIFKDNIVNEEYFMRITTNYGKELTFLSKLISFSNDLLIIRKFQSRFLDNKSFISKLLLTNSSRGYPVHQLVHYNNLFMFNWFINLYYCSYGDNALTIDNFTNHINPKDTYNGTPFSTACLFQHKIMICSIIDNAALFFKSKKEALLYLLSSEIYKSLLPLDFALKENKILTMKCLLTILVKNFSSLEEFKIVFYKFFHKFLEEPDTSNNTKKLIVNLNKLLSDRNVTILSVENQIAFHDSSLSYSYDFKMFFPNVVQDEEQRGEIYLFHYRYFHDLITKYYNNSILDTINFIVNNFNINLNLNVFLIELYDDMLTQNKDSLTKHFSMVLQYLLSSLYVKSFDSKFIFKFSNIIVSFSRDNKSLFFPSVDLIKSSIDKSHKYFLYLNEDNFNVFHLAILNQDIHVVESFLKNYASSRECLKFLLEFSGVDGNTCLHHAAILFDSKILDLILSYSDEVYNSKELRRQVLTIINSYGRAPLHQACVTHSYNTAKILIARLKSCFDSKLDFFNYLAKPIVVLEENFKSHLISDMSAFNLVLQTGSLNIAALIYDECDKIANISLMKDLILQKNDMGSISLHSAAKNKPTTSFILDKLILLGEKNNLYSLISQKNLNDFTPVHVAIRYSIIGSTQKFIKIICERFQVDSNAFSFLGEVLFNTLTRSFAINYIRNAYTVTTIFSAIKHMRNDVNDFLMPAILMLLKNHQSNDDNILKTALRFKSFPFLVTFLENIKYVIDNYGNINKENLSQLYSIIQTFSNLAIEWNEIEFQQDYIEPLLESISNYINHPKKQRPDHHVAFFSVTYQSILAKQETKYAERKKNEKPEQLKLSRQESRSPFSRFAP